VDGISTQRCDGAPPRAQNGEIPSREMAMRPPTFVAALAALAAASSAAAPVPRSIDAGSADISPFPPPGLAPLIVTPQFGGRIFGFDIDPNGTEGILSEAQDLADGNVLAAVETFDQRTGAILRVIAQQKAEDDYLTLGVVGRHAAIVEYEHEVAFLDIVRTFPVLDPIGTNRFTGRWTPPIDDHHLIEAISRNHGTNTFVAYAYDNSDSFEPQVFSSDLADGTFGPLIVMTDASFQTGLVPKLAYDESMKKALLGIQTIGNPFIPPTFALVDVASGATTLFAGVGQGDVNGLAIDSAMHVACTTTEIDFSVQFYDLTTLTGFNVTLPGATNQFYSGADVAVDPVHHFFLVAQPNSSTSNGDSSIYVYDTTGALVESLHGFHFSNAGNVVAMHIALHPLWRYGFVDGPDPGVAQIESFVY
jgi:hypothetical protein